jgi:WS/DGAT/MGAT family acyltransferase
MDRLSAADLMMVWPDDYGWPADIGALVVLDGRRLVSENGTFDLERVRAHVASRLHLVPKFRKVMHRPRRFLGWPLWVDDARFDVAHHVGEVAVPVPAGDAEILATCEALRRTPFDRSRPLWGMSFLTGLPDGRVAAYMKVHHAIADGVAGVATLAAFVDLVADAERVAAPEWRPERGPTDAELFIDNVRRKAAALGRVARAVAHPAQLVRSAMASWPMLREVFGGEQARRNSLNRRIGSDRLLRIVRGRLDAYKEIAHAHGATVNDVLMTVVAGGLRELLRSRGERVDGVVLRAFVPVALNRQDGHEANMNAGLAVSLPVGEADDVRRLESIAAETSERKRTYRPSGDALFRNVAIQRLFLKFSTHQHIVNAYVANVPGPAEKLFFAGAPIVELFPVVPITGNMTLGVGALSYAGQFNITAVGDRGACRDIEVFVAGLERSLRALRTVAAVPAISRA